MTTEFELRGLEEYGRANDIKQNRRADRRISREHKQFLCDNPWIVEMHKKSVMREERKIANGWNPATNKWYDPLKNEQVKL